MIAGPSVKEEQLSEREECASAVGLRLVVADSYSLRGELQQQPEGVGTKRSVSGGGSDESRENVEGADEVQEGARQSEGVPQDSDCGPRLRAEDGPEKPHRDLDGLSVKCKRCGKIFNKQSSLDRHLPRAHEDEKPYQCGVCNLRFKAKYNLIEHTWIHTGEKPYECKFCKKRFSHNGHFLRHVETHNGA
ncbi:zinc finger protein 436-like [Frankliniella occidentalis]|uniref:Zinc finger protein 436-like n=1 Tax=Frankliniella occidentalis TaxID=133901 RepID=A0A6J1RYB3_FRAOC|nr:zinc finger protein 436-like [Frankliniella occidentalis]